MSHFRSAAFSGIIAAASLAALTGCTSVQVKLGWKVYLDRTPVQSIAASLPQGPGISPGQKSPLVVTFTEPDGKILTTEGKGGGKVMWKELNVTASVVTVKNKGVLSLDRDPRASDGKVGHVTVTVPSHPDLRTELDVPLRYDRKYTANFPGDNGMDGSDGLNGTDGLSGSPGSLDPNNPSPGGNGGDGSDGTDGGNGSDGGSAPPVQIRVALRAGTHPLLQVSVSSSGKQRFYLIDPDGGSLTVTADGGRGGNAGRGGRGGHGGMGGVGSPNGSSGRDGHDGHDGLSGLPGSGGLITVTSDPQAKPYLGVIHLSSGNGPAPVFKEETVAALW